MVSQILSLLRFEPCPPKLRRADIANLPPRSRNKLKSQFPNTNKLSRQAPSMQLRMSLPPCLPSCLQIGSLGSFRIEQGCSLFLLECRECRSAESGGFPDSNLLCIEINLSCLCFEQVLDDFLFSKTKSAGEDDSIDREEHRKKSRHQKFRELGGHSKESLQRSYIVSILRQIPALPGLEVEFRPHDNWNTEFEEEGSSQELPVDVRWPFSAVSELGEEDILRVDWNVIPACADPLRGFGYKTRVSPTERRSSRRKGDCCHDDGREDGKLVRGERKRSQVESIATALKLLNLPAGSVVVDFGSGSGALSLPLACLFKEFTFVCVDYKQESLRLLDLRAQAALLSNLSTWQGQIEDYVEPFDACVALHACGHATDLALMQALRWRAGYVVSPCCVGKIQFAVGSPSCSGIVYDTTSYTPENSKNAVAPKIGYVFPNLSNSGNERVHIIDVSDHLSTAVVLRNDEIEKLQFNAGTLRSIRVASLTKTVTSKQEIHGNLSEVINHTDNATEMQAECESLPVQQSGVGVPCLTYPRSQWLRAAIPTDDFLLLARTADWSSYDYDSWTSRLHSLCKVMVELDRNQASQELGYRPSLLSLADQKAGVVGVSHILVGKPPQ